MVRLVPRIELNVVTGFLGSGKTTLLKNFLGSQSAETTVVIINEFGRESIDDHLTLHLRSEIRTIADGCLCCTVLDDLRATLLDILARRARGEFAALERIVIETSGLAEPAPIFATVLEDENLNEYLQIGPCVATFDALEGADSASRFEEAAAQLASADRIAITKLDLVDDAAGERVRQHVRTLNPSCDIVDEVVPQRLFDHANVSRRTTRPSSEKTLPSHRHSHGVTSFSIAVAEPLDWATFSVWLTALLNRHGQRILRFKSVLVSPSDRSRLTVQGVRHRVYPPTHLPALSTDDDGKSRLVFITQGIDETVVRDSLKRFSDYSSGAFAPLINA